MVQCHMKENRRVAPYTKPSCLHRCMAVLVAFLVVIALIFCCEHEGHSNKIVIVDNFIWCAMTRQVHGQCMVGHKFKKKF